MSVMRTVSIILRQGDHIFVSRRQGKSPNNFNHRLQVPGGVIYDSESPREAAVRETMEEIGFRIDGEYLDYLGMQTHRKPDGSPYITHVFSGEAPTYGVPENREPEKATDWEAVSLDKLVRMKSITMLPGLHDTLRKLRKILASDAHVRI